MMKFDINEIIEDHHIRREGYIFQDGFVFTFDPHGPAIFNRIVIRTPEFARCDETRMGFSYRTLEEHIELINEYKIEKALIMCDKLEFILQCPSLNDIQICPSFDAKEDFDYSVLYQMPNLRSLSCNTVYGAGSCYKTTIDYSRIDGLENLAMIEYGHLGYEKVPTLKELWISENKKIHSFEGLSCSPVLENVTFLGCGIRCLDGIENYKMLKSLTLWHNYSLNDISAMKFVSESLTELSIDACSRIKDFTVLNSLENLEYLSLDGNNIFPNLEFLKKMKKLKVFTFTMNVEDGDLSNCMAIPYVCCRNRKHYNLKDKELPKNLL